MTDGSNTSMQITPRYDFGDFVKITFYFSIRSFTTWIFAGVLFIAMLLGILNGLSISKGGYFEALLISIGVSVILIGIFVVIFYLIICVWQYNKLEKIDSTIIVDAKGFSVEQSNHINVSFPWNNSTSVKNIYNFYVFYWGKQARAFVNKKSFANADEENQFISLCKSMIQNVNTTGVNA